VPNEGASTASGQRCPSAAQGLHPAPARVMEAGSLSAGDSPDGDARSPHQDQPGTASSACTQRSGRGPTSSGRSGRPSLFQPLHPRTEQLPVLTVIPRYLQVPCEKRIAQEAEHLIEAPFGKRREEFWQTYSKPTCHVLGVVETYRPGCPRLRVEDSVDVDAVATTSTRPRGRAGAGAPVRIGPRWPGA